MHLLARGSPRAPCTCPALGAGSVLGAGCCRNFRTGRRLQALKLAQVVMGSSVCLQACRPTSPCRGTPCRRACRLGLGQDSCSQMGRTR